MINIRRGVFETNSSSSHSLVMMSEEKDHILTPEEIAQEFYLYDDGVYTIWSSTCDFGRSPFDVLTTFRDKFNYAYANFWGNADKLNDLCEILYRYVPQIYSVKWDDDWGPTIDECNLEYWLNELGITLEDYLVNTRYVVIVDGDEYNVWDRLKKSGFVDMKKIEKEVM